MIKNIKDMKKGSEQSVQIEISDTKLILCKECGGSNFVPALKLGVLSPLHPKNLKNQELILPFQTHVCAFCDTEIDLSQETPLP